MDLEKAMHGTARLWVHLGKMDGYRFDKKALRFNEIVDVAFRYGRCGEKFRESVAWGGLREAVESCSTDFPEMYSGAGVADLCPEWMTYAADPRRAV